MRTPHGRSSYPANAGYPVRRGLPLITGVSGILDRPPSRAMTVESAVRARILFSNNQNRHCERSEAIHGAAQRKKWNCFAPLAMTTRYDSAISPRVFRARFALQRPLSSKRGRGECRMPNAPAARRAEKQAAPVVTVATGLPETPSIPARNGFNSYFVLSPAIGLFCRRRLTDIAGPRPVGPTSPPQDLTPASRCQDHTTSPYASAPFVRTLVNGSQIFRQSALPSRGAQALPRPSHPVPRS
jgi:hypothetical protein